jgi:hypothetical protein
MFNCLGHHSSTLRAWAARNLILKPLSVSLSTSAKVTHRPASPGPAMCIMTLWNGSLESGAEPCHLTTQKTISALY